MGTERFFDLILHGIVETPPWQSLMTELRTYYDCSLVCLIWQPSRFSKQKNNGSGTARWDIDDWRAKYLERWRQFDPFSRETLEPCKVYSFEDFIPRDSLIQSPFYTECLQPSGMEYALCVFLEEPGGYQGWLYLFRDASAGEFNEAIKNDLREIALRLQHAVHVFAALKRRRIERDVYESTLAAMHIGSIIFDQTGKVLRVDRIAHAILDELDTISIVEDRIRIQSKERSLQFSRICEELRENTTDVRGMNIPRREGSELRLLVRRLPEHFEYSRRQNATFTLFIADSTCTPAAISGKLIAEIFGLTKSESAVAAILASGAPVSDITATLHLTESTVRSYIKQIYAKMGINRQAELIAIVSKSLAMVAHEPVTPVLAAP